MHEGSPVIGIIFLVLLLAVPIALSLVCLAHLDNRDLPGPARKSWLLLLMTLPFIGPLLYLLSKARRSPRRK